MLGRELLIVNLIILKLNQFTFCRFGLSLILRIFPQSEKEGKLRLIIAPNEQDGAIKIYQDAYLYVSVLKPGDEIDYKVKPNRYAWLQVIKGIVLLNGESLRAGDGVQISTTDLLNLSTEVGTEILLFDLA